MITDNQAGIFAVEHKIWVKMNENLFKKMICNSYLSLNWMEIFVGTSVRAAIMIEQFQIRTGLNIELENACPFSNHISTFISIFQYLANCAYI